MTNNKWKKSTRARLTMLEAQDKLAELRNFLDREHSDGGSMPAAGDWQAGMEVDLGDLSRGALPEPGSPVPVAFPGAKSAGRRPAGGEGPAKKTKRTCHRCCHRCGMWKSTVIEGHSMEGGTSNTIEKVLDVRDAEIEIEEDVDGCTTCGMPGELIMCDGGFTAK